jgi:hypothetical protein
MAGVKYMGPAPDVIGDDRGDVIIRGGGDHPGHRSGRQGATHRVVPESQPEQRTDSGIKTLGGGDPLICRGQRGLQTVVGTVSQSGDGHLVGGQGGMLNAGTPSGVGEGTGYGTRCLVLRRSDRGGGSRNSGGCRQDGNGLTDGQGK